MKQNIPVPVVIVVLLVLVAAIGFAYQRMTANPPPTATGPNFGGGKGLPDGAKEALANPAGPGPATGKPGEKGHTGRGAGTPQTKGMAAPGSAATGTAATGTAATDTAATDTAAPAEGANAAHASGAAAHKEPTSASPAGKP